ncbi:GTPase HflX [Sulfobacillus harzensis]|uniref:GTPase HflX n=1 Tax=Sulfobacillus harzensis TaxID=2729629 RepID=A0A7Y0Q2D9_9FIRM|nr:GTPase HflX [Sulfobacillus harzensis]NMP21811.1 GTPase HflX [Sulfobacillus harzensis]
MRRFKALEKAILVSVYPKGTNIREVDRQLEELQGLVGAAGADTAGVVRQARDVPEAGLGQGALDALIAQVEAMGADLVVFNQEMRPSQLLWVQTRLGARARVVDRTQVILDIFARRASSREGRLQVELAQYEYLEPRLRGLRVLSRPGGGVGTRGPGETQLELDRRRVQRRVHALKEELERVEEERRGRRQRRRRTELPQVALVGYTNVGKSTLFSALTHRPQFAQNALFVTLDSTVRRMVIPGFGPVLVSDTVGFVDRLPHELVAAFRSTLDEVRDADMILEVVSADPEFPVPMAEQVGVIEDTLRRLEAEAIRRLRVYSQWDRVRPGTGIPPLGVAVSAVSGDGMSELLGEMARQLAALLREEQVEIAWEDQESWKIIWREFVILDRHDGRSGAVLTLRGTERAFHLLDQAARKGQGGNPEKDGTIM